MAGAFPVATYGRSAPAWRLSPCGPWTSPICLPWERVRSASSGPTPDLLKQMLWGGGGLCRPYLNRPSRGFWCTPKYEHQCSKNHALRPFIFRHFSLFTCKLQLFLKCQSSVGNPRPGETKALCRVRVRLCPCRDEGISLGAVLQEGRPACLPHDRPPRRTLCPEGRE